MKFDLCLEYFYFTSFPFSQQLQMSRYDSVESIWLSSPSDMQPWPQYSFQQDIPVCPFRLCIIPDTSDPRFTERKASGELLLKHKRGGRFKWCRWLCQNETQVGKLNSYNKGNCYKKTWNLKEKTEVRKAFVVVEPKLTQSLVQEILSSRSGR